MSGLATHPNKPNKETSSGEMQRKEIQLMWHRHTAGRLQLIFRVQT
jgi:hypothetical protein